MANDTTRKIEWNGESREIEPLDAKVVEVSSGEYLISSGNRIHEVFSQTGLLSNGVTLDQIELKVETAREKVLRERFHSLGVTGVAGKTGNHIVKAPMPGLVRAIKVGVGDQVEKATTIVILEAMKMENNILAGAKGVIRKVLVEQGTSVDKNVALIEIELA